MKQNHNHKLDFKWLLAPSNHPIHSGIEEILLYVLLLLVGIVVGTCLLFIILQFSAFLMVKTSYFEELISYQLMTGDIVFPKNPGLWRLNDQGLINLNRKSNIYHSEHSS